MNATTGEDSIPFEERPLARAVLRALKWGAAGAGACTAEATLGGVTAPLGLAGAASTGAFAGALLTAPYSACERKSETKRKSEEKKGTMNIRNTREQSEQEPKLNTQGVVAKATKGTVDDSARINGYTALAWERGKQNLPTTLVYIRSGAVEMAYAGTARELRDAERSGAEIESIKEIGDKIHIERNKKERAEKARKDRAFQKDLIEDERSLREELRLLREDERLFVEYDKDGMIGCGLSETGMGTSLGSARMRKNIFADGLPIVSTDENDAKKIVIEYEGGDKRVEDFGDARTQKRWGFDMV